MAELSKQIADRLAARILAGELMSGDRLPSEAELAAAEGCSRATVREALKRLAARNLIRTRRGHAGGAFVNRLTFDAAVEAHAATSTILLSMNAVDFATAAEARFALERAVAPLAAARATPADLAALDAALDRLGDASIDDTAFCAADVAFHRALVDAADNPVLGYQLAGAVEGMQPLMNMITYPERDRAEMLALYRDMRAALAAGDATALDTALSELERTMLAMFERGAARRAQPRVSLAGPPRPH